MLFVVILCYYINEIRNLFNFSIVFFNYNISCCFCYLKFRFKELFLFGRLFVFVIIVGQRENEYCEKIRIFLVVFLNWVLMYEFIFVRFVGIDCMKGFWFQLVLLVVLLIRLLNKIYL